MRGHLHELDGDLPAAATTYAEAARRATNVAEREHRSDKPLAPARARCQGDVVDVLDAESGEDLDEVRRLFREFVAWHHDRQQQNTGLVTSYFDDAEWQAELDTLPGAYAATEGGALLLARDHGSTLGCVALRHLDDESCEMKRMYVDGAGRGRGVGRALGEKVVQRARDLDYDVMYLDTSVEQHEAIGLYRSLGFEECEPYHDVPDAMRGWLVFFRLDL